MTEFRTATRDELDHVLGWAADEGWNPGLEDAEAFYAADPDGFFVAVEDGAPVASISVVNHSDAFSFLGLYIVTASRRGQGIGFRLWQHAIAHAVDRTIGLDGVPEQQANYAVSGFQPAAATTRFTGKVAPRAVRTIRLAGDSDIAGLIKKEAAVTGVRKPAYLAKWFTNTPSRVTLVAGNGFCTVRQCRAGAKVGPLLADDLDTAGVLLGHAATVFGEDISIDVPDSSNPLAQKCLALGLSPGFATARMYRGPRPSTERSLFAVTSLELG